MRPFVFLFITLSLSALILPLGDFSRLAFLHAFFVAAALPLMLAAIFHFVPVLTRTGSPARCLRWLPWLLVGCGFSVVAIFALDLSRFLLYFPALLMLASVLLSLFWIKRRISQCLGNPHPGVYWYFASLSCLLLGLLAVLGMLLQQHASTITGAGHYAHLRNLHVHINLFGWISLTALGTLPILLPTVLQKMEPGATLRLRRDFPWAVLGVLGIAFGAAWPLPGLAITGTLLILWVLLHHAFAWRKTFNAQNLWQGASFSLLGAVIFFVMLLFVGILHGIGQENVSSDRLPLALIFGFLFPLVLGALTQLFPVWRYPGPTSLARSQLQQALSRHAAARAILCFIAGFMQLFGLPWAAWPVVFALFFFLFTAL